jgi:hypothetical protein
MSSVDIEEHRHRCEVRFLIGERKKRGVHWLRDFLSKKEVAPRRERLEKDIAKQWRLGNIGNWGDWR